MITYKEFTQRTKIVFLLTAFLVLTGCSCNITDSRISRNVDKNELQNIRLCLADLIVKKTKRQDIRPSDLTPAHIACLLEKVK